MEDQMILMTLFTHLHMITTRTNRMILLPHLKFGHGEEQILILLITRRPKVYRDLPT